jgi:hypothetical protein
MELPIQWKKKKIGTFFNTQHKDHQDVMVHIQKYIEGTLPQDLYVKDHLFSFNSQKMDGYVIIEGDMIS